MTNRQKNRPRLADVAKLAQTSQAAVSVVLNGRVGESARVSEDTQARIWDAVRRLGYTANPVARSLAGGRNRIIGVFTFEPTFPMGERDFYYPFLIGVEAEAAARGYDLLLFASAGAEPGERRTIYRNGVNRLQLADGAILLGRTPDRAELGRLAANGFPFAYIGRRDTPDGTPISYSAADYADATAQMVRYMQQHGHRKFIYLRVPDEAESSLDRETGYLGAAPDGDVWYGQPDDVTVHLLQHILRAGVTAILTEGDAFGLAVLNVAQQIGLRCPEHFSLGVLGDPMLPLQNLPDWTRFRIPREAMGREAVRILLTMLDEPETPTPIQVMLPCTFEAGSTVAAPPFSLDFV